MARALTLMLLSAALSLSQLGCVTVAAHPCTKGGQPAHDDGKIGKGTKQCLQVKDTAGAYINQGKYTEWYANGQRALDGEYTSGLKTGKWTEWDDQGRKLSEKWYEGGQIIPGREEKPYNGLGVPPLPGAKAAPAPELPTMPPTSVPPALH